MAHVQCSAIAPEGNSMHHSITVYIFYSLDMTYMIHGSLTGAVMNEPIAGIRPGVKYA